MLPYFVYGNCVCFYNPTTQIHHPRELKSRESYVSKYVMLGALPLADYLR